MSMYSFARTMMAPFAKHNPFIELVPGMEPLTKTTEGWMDDVSDESSSLSSVMPGADVIAANMDAMAKTVPGFQSMPNLMAHPMGAVAAGSAVTMGMAGQMMGAMYGTMTGMMEGAAKAGNTMPDTVGAMPGMDAMPPFVAAFLPDAPVPAKAKTKAKRAPAAKKAAPAANVAQPAPKATVTPIAKAAPKPTAEARANGVAKPDAPVPAAEPVAAIGETRPAATKAAAAPKTAAKSTVAKAPVAKTGKAPAPKPATEPVATGIMPEDFTQPAKRKKPAKPDDLKQIAGVGPKLEQVLNGLGIWTFGQIAKWSPSEVAWVDDYLQFKGRIERDDWIAQARALAKAPAKATA